MKFLFLLSVLIASTYSQCYSLNFKSESESNKKKDSLEIIANLFLTYDVFLNSYVVSDRDIEEAVLENKSIVNKYFPVILKKYDMTLYSQFSLACYLYKTGNKKHLENLWNKNKKFAGNSTQKIQPNEEFKPIINILDYFKIKL